jgi:hypothetical protein
MTHVRPTALVAAFAILAAFAGQSARAQVLQQVPSDAMVVFKVSNLKAVSDKAAKFAGALGLAEMSPEFGDPLAALQENMQIKEGLDAAGEMAFVFMKPASEGAPPEESMLVLVPTTDFKAFLGNFEGVRTEGAISSFKPEGKEEDVFVAQRGKYAAISGNKAALGKKPTGLKLSGLAAKEAEERDAFLFVNMPVIKDMVLPQLQGARTNLLETIEQELGANEEGKQFAGVAKAAATKALDIAEGFLSDTTAASLSLHLSDEGISTTGMIEFKPETYFGKIAGQLKNSDQPLMAGLPNRKYFMFGGIVNEPKVSAQLMGDLLDPITKELAGTESAKGVAEAIEAAKRSMAATKSVSFGYPAPTGALGADSIVQSVMVIKGDATALHEAQKKMLDTVAELMKMMPQQEGAPQFVYEYTPGGKTLGSLKFDTYKYELKMDENDPAAAQVQQTMAMIYGPNGMGAVFGPVDADTYIVVQGGNDKLLAEAVKAAQAPQDVLSNLAAVKMVAGHLPAKRMLVEYIALDNIIMAGVKYAQGFGMPIKMQLPPNLPPIGIAVASEGTAIRMDGFLPTQLVQSVVAAGMQTYMQMQGGGGAEEGDGL